MTQPATRSHADLSPHVFQKRHLYYFWNNSDRRQSISIKFVMQHREERGTNLFFSFVHLALKL